MLKVRILNEVRSATQASSKGRYKEYLPPKDKYTDTCLNCPYEKCKTGECALIRNQRKAKRKANEKS